MCIEKIIAFLEEVELEKSSTGSRSWWRSKNMKKILLGLVLALGLAACGDKAEAPKENEKPVVKIGVLYPMSGNAAFFGDGAKNATELFFSKFNEKEAKFKYEILWEDTQANPAKAVLAVRKLIDYDKVDVVLDAFSSVGNAVSPITNEKKTPHLTFAQDRSISNGFYNYRVVTSTKKTGQKMIEALKARNLHNIVGVVENTAGTLSLYNGFSVSARKDANINILDTVEVNPGEKDFNIILQKINNLQPDAVVVSLQAPEVDIFMKQAKQNELKMPIVGIQSFSFLKDKKLAEDYWYVDVAFADKNFLSDYKKTFGEDITNFAENFYTLLQVVVNNYETFVSENKPSAEDFINNMSSVNNIISPLGQLNLDKEEQNVDSEASIRLIKDGKIVEIEE